jgi:hypothetical protein
MVASPTLAMMTPVATPGGRPTTPRVADAHAELVHRLTSLQQTLQKKESQVQKLLNEKHTSGIKAQYERVVSDMIRQQTSLQAQQASLQKKLKAVDVRAPTVISLIAAVLIQLDSASSCVGAVLSFGGQPTASRRSRPPSSRT